VGGRRRAETRIVQRSLLWLDVACKCALVGLLAFGAFSGLQQFEDKAFGWRLATYPIAAVVVPVGWWLAGRRPPYPYALDVLVVAPFLVDVLGNTFDLYDSISWWDDANHFVNWALLSLGVGQLLVRLEIPRLEMFVLIVGVGATAAVLWELAEYFAFIRNSSEVDTAYEDTLGDMALGLAGSTVAAVVTVSVFARRRAQTSTMLNPRSSGSALPEG
jgi:hypothetical protein